MEYTERLQCYSKFIWQFELFLNNQNSKIGLFEIVFANTHMTTTQETCRRRHGSVELPARSYQKHIDLLVMSCVNIGKRQPTNTSTER